MVTRRSSIGCRITSNTVRLNSGNSSRNNTPWCAKEISPGCGFPPPPTRATSDTVWCGERKGRFEIKVACSGSLPATEWILVVSNASAKCIGGNMVGRRLANIVLPAPGGPIKITLCAPAAAISIARLIWNCPFTSAKSISKSCCACWKASSTFTLTGGKVARSFKKSTNWLRCEIPYTVNPFTIAASRSLALGRNTASKPSCCARNAMGKAPLMGNTLPSSESSPIIT